MPEGQGRRACRLSGREDQLYCLSCGATGAFSLDGDKVCMTVTPSVHNWRTKEEKISHCRWLIGQREEFLHQRDRLKEVVKPYIGGEFI